MEKIGDGVYHLPDIIGGPTILLGETVVLVDTGVPGSDDAILAAVEEIGRNATDVTDIVITHADGDHVGSPQRSSPAPARPSGPASTRRT